MKVLFVCLGNICRSPMAEGVFRSQVSEVGLKAQITIDSAGTGDWHIGHPPDERARAAASTRGIDLSTLRARQVSVADLSHFDYVIVMDNKNLDDVKSLGAPEHHGKIHLFLSFLEDNCVQEVPDPYYGGEEGFEYALNLLEQASQGLLKHLSAKLTKA